MLLFCLLPQGASWFSASSLRLSRATLVASITNAEKVAPVPRIASSTWSIISFGNRIDFGVVGGITGTLNLAMSFTTHYILYFTM